MTARPVAGIRPAIRFDHVSKAFDDRPAVEDIDLAVAPGSFTVLIGPSGCGKSTLLGMSAGLEPPTEGYVFVHDREVKGPTEGTALLFQQHNLFPWMTAAGNVAFALENTGLSRREARGEALRLLGHVGLGAFADKVPAELSGGMRQRVALVRAFALKPRLLLMDEPFGALDHQTRRMMQAYLLATWRDSGATVMLVTHDLTEALVLADRIVLMSGSPGRITEVIDVVAPRPRDLADPALAAICRRLEAHLEAEAIRGEFGPDELARLGVVS